MARRVVATATIVYVPCLNNAMGWFWSTRTQKAMDRSGMSNASAVAPANLAAPTEVLGRHQSPIRRKAEPKTGIIQVHAEDSALKAVPTPKTKAPAPQIPRNFLRTVP